MDYFFKHISEEFVRPFHNSVLIFATILFIILLAPLLLRKLRVPGIIGLILSGVAIGPHGFNLIERNAGVVLFSTIGLLYIMFMAGLDLDLREFARNRYKSFLFGFLTFAIPLGLGYPLCYHLLGFSPATSLLVASMFATHTLVAYPIVSKLGITRNEAVAVAVGGTILTDTAVLLLLAVITGRMESGDAGALWVRLGVSFLIFLVVMIFAVPWIARYFFRRLDEEKNSQYIFVLAVVFFCAFLSEMAGLEPIIGAFAAGLALNGIIPHNSALMNRIDFVGNSLFIPFFLISVGMVVDLGVFFSSYEALIVAGTLTTFALISKWSAAWLTGMIFRFSYAQRNLIFGLSASHAAATLAVINVGYQKGLVSDAILNGTIVLILFTCLIATLVTDGAAKKVAIREAEAPHKKPLRATERILVALANPATMERLIDLAHAFKLPRSAYPIYGLCVVDDDDDSETQLVQARKSQESAHTYVNTFGGLFEGISTIDQNVASGIRRVSKEVGGTDIVMGSTEKSNLTDMFFGRMVEQVTDSTQEAIWIFHANQPLANHNRFHIIVPPYAEKEPGFVAWLSRAARLANAMNFKTVVHTIPDTFRVIQAANAHFKLNFQVEFSQFEDWDDFLVLSREFGPKSLILTVVARKGAVSHTAAVETAPRKLAKHFNAYSYIVLYPETLENDDMREFTRDFDPTLLEIGLNQVKRGASGIGKLLKKKDG
jgi:Kef-type K+ transport system membrane component KefB